MQKLNNLTLKQREELFRQLRISITHHSNAMEGTTLSFGETKELLEHGNTAGDKPLHEQLVILGFAKAYDVIVREAANKENVIESTLAKIEKAQGKIVKSIFEFPGGRRFHFSDPSGNEYAVWSDQTISKEVAREFMAFTITMSQMQTGHLMSWQAMKLRFTFLS